ERLRIDQECVDRRLRPGREREPRVERERARLVLAPRSDVDLDLADLGERDLAAMLAWTVGRGRRTQVADLVVAWLGIGHELVRAARRQHDRGLGLALPRARASRDRR